MKSGPSSDEVPDLLGDLVKKRGVMSRRVLGGKAVIFQERRKVYSVLLFSVPVLVPLWLFFYIYVSPELKGVTEPSRADPITIPSFL